jgi:hypothetical protein
VLEDFSLLLTIGSLEELSSREWRRAAQEGRGTGRIWVPFSTGGLDLPMTKISFKTLTQCCTANN